MTHHKKTYHSDTRFTWKCDICTKILGTKYDLKRHIREVHENVTIKPFACESCDMTFRTKQYLEAHQKAIHEDQRYQCKNCDRFFSYELSLKQHEAKNHSNGPLKCKKCQLEVKNTTELRIHMKKIHDGLVFTYCNCCERYMAVDSLAGHFRKNHKKESKDKLLQLYKQNGPYKCKDCKKEYEYPHSLYIHERVNHKGKNPQSKPCKFCNKMLSSTSLSRHLKTMHT